MIRHFIMYNIIHYITNNILCFNITYNCTLQYSTADYITVQLSTVYYRTVQYSTVQYGRLQFSTVQQIT